MFLQRETGGKGRNKAINVEAKLADGNIQLYKRLGNAPRKKNVKGNQKTLPKGVNPPTRKRKMGVVFSKGRRTNQLGWR